MPTSPLIDLLATLLPSANERGAPSPDPVPDWFPAAFPLFFAALWVLVTTLLGWIAGHMTLLARYPPTDEPLQEKFGWASGSMRGVSFNSALHVGLGQRGLHLAPTALFRPVFSRGIPCIPWAELRLVRPQPAGWIARAFVGSKFEIPAVGLRFALAGAAGRAVERRLSHGGAAGIGGPRPSLVRE